MIGIITGDIINSRKLSNQELWQSPLKSLLNEWGSSPQSWEIFRGDFFQMEIRDPLQSLRAAIRIKALIKSLEISDDQKRKSDIDVRLAIGIGSKDFESNRISECNGSAFVFSGEKYESLKKEKISLAIKSAWDDFDREINLYLKLAIISMDKWSYSSAEIVNIVLKHHNKTQAEIGDLLGIGQNSVSGRFSRANLEEILEVERMFKEKLRRLIS
jgi:uncharacterized UBP type Zn finger protein